jgi:dolichyl-diphosphooligosaccharide--protein glycosyltransferase
MVGWQLKFKTNAFFSPRGEYKVDAGASQTMKDSLMYKLSYYRFGENFGGENIGQDRVRGAQVPTQGIELSTLDEAFTSEHFIVRIYKVKQPDNLGRSLIHKSRSASKFSCGDQS